MEYRIRSCVHTGLPITFRSLATGEDLAFYDFDDEEIIVYPTSPTNSHVMATICDDVCNYRDCTTLVTVPIEDISIDTDKLFAKMDNMMSKFWYENDSAGIIKESSWLTITLKHIIRLLVYKNELMIKYKYEDICDMQITEILSAIPPNAKSARPSAG